MIKHCERVLNDMKEQELHDAEDSDLIKVMYYFYSEVLDSEHINDFNYAWVLYHLIITLLNSNID